MGNISGCVVALYHHLDSHSIVQIKRLTAANLCQAAFYLSAGVHQRRDKRGKRFWKIADRVGSFAPDSGNDRYGVLVCRVVLVPVQADSDILRTVVCEVFDRSLPLAGSVTLHPIRAYKVCRNGNRHSRVMTRRYTDL